MTINALGLFASLLMLASVIELLRRGILREKFAALWLAVSTLMVLGAVFPGVIRAGADALGFALPSNLLFFTAILFLLLVAVQLTHEVSLLEARTRRLAEEIALLRDEVRESPSRWDSARD